jgi:hypothetical protein
VGLARAVEELSSEMDKGEATGGHGSNHKLAHKLFCHL